MTPTIHSLPRRRRLARARLDGPAADRRRPARRHLARHDVAPARDAAQGPAQWLSAHRAGRRSLPRDGAQRPAVVARCATTAPSRRAGVDLLARHRLASARSRSTIHVENPCRPAPGGSRVLLPGRRFALEPVFIGLRRPTPTTRPGSTTSYLRRRSARAVPARTVTFNSNGVDDEPHLDRRQGRHGPREVRAGAPIARALGVETFILDDGWQARSRRLVPRLARLPGAARGLRSPTALPRRDVRRGARRRSRR